MHSEIAIHLGSQTAVVLRDQVPRSAGGPAGQNIRGSGGKRGLIEIERIEPFACIGKGKARRHHATFLKARQSISNCPGWE